MLHRLLALVVVVSAACTQAAESSMLGPEAGSGGSHHAAGSSPAQGGSGGSTEPHDAGQSNGDAGHIASPDAGNGAAGGQGGSKGHAGSGGSTAGRGGTIASAGQGGGSVAVGGQGGAAAGQGGAAAGQGGIGGSAGSVGGAAGAEPEPEPECDDVDAPYCEGLTVVECSSGEWTAGETCPFLCSDGACSGVCVPGTTQCSASGPQTCSETGEWVTDEGACTPSSRRCDGLSAQVCNECGEWELDQACPFICSGEGVCGGVCAPGATQCSVSGPQTCSETGEWVTDAGACTPNARRCDGLKAQSCNNCGEWVTEDTCDFVCSAGECSGECVPTAKQCTGNAPQICDGSGSWQTQSTCPYVCLSGECSGVCVPGEQRCSGDQIQTCTAAGQWGTALDCPAVTGAIVTCDASTDSCIVADCDETHADCNNDLSDGCEVDLKADANNCGACGHDCCGGSCQEGQCGLYDTGIAAGTDIRSYAVDRDYIYAHYNREIVRYPRAGGAYEVIVSEHIENGGTVQITAGFAIHEETGTIAWTSRYSDQQSTTSINYLHIAKLNTPIETKWMYAGLPNAQGEPTYHYVTSPSIIYARKIGSLAYGVLLDATNVYWTSLSWVYWDPIDSADPISHRPPSTPATRIQKDAEFLVLGGGYLYAAARRREITRFDVSDGSMMTFLDNSQIVAAVTGLAHSGQDVFYRDGNSTIWKVSPDANQINLYEEPVYSYPSLYYSGTQVAVDETHVYFETVTRTGPTSSYVNIRFRKMSIEDGAITDLATLPITATTLYGGLRVYDECLYFGHDKKLYAIAVEPTVTP